MKELTPMGARPHISRHRNSLALSSGRILHQRMATEKVRKLLRWKQDASNSTLPLQTHHNEKSETHRFLHSPDISLVEIDKRGAGIRQFCVLMQQIR